MCGGFSPTRINCNASLGWARAALELRTSRQVATRVPLRAAAERVSTSRVAEQVASCRTGLLHEDPSLLLSSYKQMEKKGQVVSFSQDGGMVKQGIVPPGPDKVSQIASCGISQGGATVSMEDLELSTRSSPEELSGVTGSSPPRYDLGTADRPDLNKLDTLKLVWQAEFVVASVVLVCSFCGFVVGCESSVAV
ncbi:hypothetical protein NDU88_000430 [Pleurodeles waltl]|uniref:Uncharacterized protein n=1 Tax=Pleurodeles waltl TaxID=8319 RepID=A0AAV7S7P5_PLEWA|nr:hypothetical protein NDU88_000430 [Pleurodeles waltl]